MGGYYLNKFSKYLARMQKLQSVLCDKYDLIGLDDSAKRGMLASLALVPIRRVNVTHFRFLWRGKSRRQGQGKCVYTWRSHQLSAENGCRRDPTTCR